MQSGVRKAIGPLLLSVAAGSLIYLGGAVLGGDREVLIAMARLTLSGWLMILGLSLVNYVLRMFRWHWYLLRLGHTVPVGISFAYYILGFAFTTSPGKVGEAVRSLYLKPHGVRYADSLAAFLSERLLDALAIVLLGTLAMLHFEETRVGLVIVGVVILTALPLLHSRRLRTWVEYGAQRFASPVFRKTAAHTAFLLNSSAVLLRSTVLYAGLMLGLIAWAAEGVALYLILEHLDAHIPLSIAVGIYAASIFAGAITLIPGGLGSTEAVMGVLLTISGVDLPTTVAATIICRAATLWFAVVLGCLAMVAVEFSKSREQQPAPD